MKHRRSKYRKQPGAENSHQPTHHPERATRGLHSAGGTQRFLSAFTGISPYFRPRLHVLSAQTYRREMDTRFATRNEIVGLPTAA